MKILLKILIMVMALLLAGCYVQPRTVSYGVNTRAMSYDKGYYNKGYYSRGYNNEHHNGYYNGSSYQHNGASNDRVIRDHRYDSNHQGRYFEQYHQDGHHSGYRRNRY